MNATIFLEIQLLEITKYITHPISLVAFACALVTYYFIARNINDRKKLQANPEAYQATAERLHLDFKLIPKTERADITLKVLRNRIISQLIVAGSFILGGLIIAYISTNYIQQTSIDVEKDRQAKFEADRIQDSIREARRIDSLKKLLADDSVTLAKNQNRESIDLFIRRAQDLMDNIKSGKQIEDKSACELLSVDVVTEIQRIEKTMPKKRFAEEWYFYTTDNKRLIFSDTVSQRIYDSTSALKELRFCIGILEELKASL